MDIRYLTPLIIIVGGARYFIREILKSYPEEERSELEAKVLQTPRRSSCVYADFLYLQKRREFFGMRAGSLTVVYDICGEPGQWTVELICNDLQSTG